MKKYLVAYFTGGSIIDSTTVETRDNYVPASDDCAMLKRLVCRKEKPEYTSVSSAPSSCGGYQEITFGGRIKPENLSLVAVSNLNV